jgi:hypothetical protein
MEVSKPKSKHSEVPLMLQSNGKIIKHKLGLLNLAEELGKVSKACQIIRLSRPPGIWRLMEADSEMKGV